MDLFTVGSYVFVAAFSFAFGKFGWPLVETVYQAYKHSRALATAKAVIAKAEADAAALAAAKAVVAAAPVAPVAK